MVELLFSKVTRLNISGFKNFWCWHSWEPCSRESVFRLGFEKQVMLLCLSYKLSGLEDLQIVAPMDMFDKLSLYT